jgi:hypothetical protein
VKAKILNLLVSTAALSLPTGLALAEEALVTLRATVTGNQEQPRVMYIMPWQQPEATEFDYRPGSGIADELFRQVDRDEFLRELEYRQMLGSTATESVNTD